MKKTITIIAMILAISVSLIAGTMSYYTITIDKLAEGSVVAKEFILKEEGSDTFQENVKIAPGDKEVWTFAVKNFDGSTISETAMDLAFSVALSANGEAMIQPLEISVAKVGSSETPVEIANIVEEDNGFSFIDLYELSDEGQTYTYQVTVSWPWGEENDNAIDFAGADFGTALSVSVTGTQVKP